MKMAAIASLFILFSSTSFAQNNFKNDDESFTERVQSDQAMLDASEIGIRCGIFPPIELNQAYRLAADDLVAAAIYSYSDEAGNLSPRGEHLFFVASRAISEKRERLFLGRTHDAKPTAEQCGGFPQAAVNRILSAINEGL